MKGFTLPELLISLAIISVLALAGSVSLSGLMKKNEQKKVTDEITRIVQYARIQSLGTGQVTTLSPADGHSWSSGIRLLYQQKTVHEWTWNLRYWRILWQGMNDSKNISISDDPAKALSNGTFIVSANDGKEELKIILNKLGRVKAGVMNAS